MTIKQLPEIVDGRLKASVEKVDASLIDLAPTGNALVATTEGLKVDLSSYATSAEVTSAIAAAQLEGQEVDLSGYATKVEVTESIATKVDKEVGKGLSTNDFTNVYKDQLDTLDSSVDTKVTSAISALVDGSPEAFDTLKEISDWIAVDESNAADLVAQIAEKADKTELAALDSKYVLQEPGKGLSSNDFTASHIAYLDSIPTLVEEATSTKLETPEPVAPASTTPTLEYSLPLYTLGNNGNYVLCTPDTWFLINGFYIPGYLPATLFSGV